MTKAARTVAILAAVAIGLVFAITMVYRNASERFVNDLLIRLTR